MLYFWIMIDSLYLMNENISCSFLTNYLVMLIWVSGWGARWGTRSYMLYLFGNVCIWWCISGQYLILRCFFWQSIWWCRVDLSEWMRKVCQGSDHTCCIFWKVCFGWCCISCISWQCLIWQSIWWCRADLSEWMRRVCQGPDPAPNWRTSRLMMGRRHF